MDKAAFAICFAVCLLSFTQAHYGRYIKPGINQVRTAGGPCKPPYIRICEKELVGGPEVMEINDTDVGPNLCSYTFTFQLSTYKFAFQRVCKRRGCYLSCACTNECDETSMVNVTRTIVDCCEGFTISRPSPLEQIQMKHDGRRHSLHRGLKKDGCPVAVCPDETTTSGATTATSDTTATTATTATSDTTATIATMATTATTATTTTTMATTPTTATMATTP